VAARPVAAKATNFAEGEACVLASVMIFNATSASAE